MFNLIHELKTGKTYLRYNTTVVRVYDDHMTVSPYLLPYMEEIYAYLVYEKGWTFSDGTMIVDPCNQNSGFSLSTGILHPENKRCCTLQELKYLIENREPIPPIGGEWAKGDKGYWNKAYWSAWFHDGHWHYSYRRDQVSVILIDATEHQWRSTNEWLRKTF